MSSEAGDPTAQRAGVAAGRQAIIDIDGDGYLDAIQARKPDPNDPNEEPPEHWSLWRGDGTGNFYGCDDAGNPLSEPLDEAVSAGLERRRVQVDDAQRVVHAEPQCEHSLEWQWLG